MTPDTAVVAQAQQLADGLLAELELARQAVLDADADALLQAAATQRRLVSSLERLVQALRALPAAERAGLESALSQCRQRNLANAALLDARRQQVQWALRRLGVGGETTYGRNGALATPVLGRMVGCA